MSTAVWPVQVGLVTVLLADAPLVALLDGDKVYNVEVPPNVTRPHRYIVVGEPGETDDNVFRKRGKDTGTRIHIWDDGTLPGPGVELSYRGVSSVYKEMERLLNWRRIAISEFTMQTGELSWITAVRDPFIPYMHQISQYRTISRVT